MRQAGILLALTLFGCGTIRNIGEGPQVYGGVRHDVRWMHDGSLDMTPVYDLPCSAILDTALLPFTLLVELVRGISGWPPPPPQAVRQLE